MQIRSSGIQVGARGCCRPAGARRTLLRPPVPRLRLRRILIRCGSTRKRTETLVMRCPAPKQLFAAPWTRKISWGQLGYLCGRRGPLRNGILSRLGRLGRSERPNHLRRDCVDGSAVFTVHVRPKPILAATFFCTKRTGDADGLASRLPDGRTRPRSCNRADPPLLGGANAPRARVAFGAQVPSSCVLAHESPGSTSSHHWPDSSSRPSLGPVGLRHAAA